jgi:AAA15 family ATPase/GTPase
MAESLLKLADFGISGIRVQDEEMPEDLRKAFRAFFENLSSNASDPPSDVDEAMEAITQVVKQIRFSHGTTENAEGDAPTLGVADESSGTVAWLALAVPAYDALRRGEVFIVDEIDSSLHPMLTATLINLFQNEHVNERGAQLIFTTHDTSLLGSLHGKTLAPEEVWLTEKNADGATDLYSLAEFPVRARDNLERRYIQGRYGAVPVISQEEIRRAIVHEVGLAS